jgi:hypothetical protein
MRGLPEDEVPKGPKPPRPSRDRLRRRFGRGTVWTGLVLLLVSVVAAAALVDALRRGPTPPLTTNALAAETPSLTGPHLPAPGLLHGTLHFVSLGRCRPQALELATLSLAAPGPRLGCDLSVSPRGDLAVARLGLAPRAPGHRIGLVDLASPPSLVRTLGVAQGETSWSADGRRLAWCAPDGATVVLTLATGARDRVTGCHPVFASDGSVITRPDQPLTTTLLRDGDPLLTEPELARAFPTDGEGPIDIVGYASRADGLLAVVAVRFETGRRPRRVLELWRGPILEAALPLPELGLPAGSGRFGERVEFSPSGNEIAAAFPGRGVQVILIDLTGRRIVLDPTSQHGFAWSPDGAWFALSTGEEILVQGPARGETVYELPIGASAIAWR